ncbi:DUF6485 family protein [Pyramidobacter sp.]|uniref:DUF6485 family protein n=1 Tax=Pyramidobacter sp. TaxID=1943581 RepID=UPI0039C721AF
MIDGNEKTQNRVLFCACTDVKCPNHPNNHSRGGEPCIAKNLALDEIPTCFFRKVDPGYRGPGYFMKDFAALVMRKNETGNERQKPNTIS